MADNKKILCSQCNNPAVFLDREKKTHLCKDHLIQSVEEEVMRYLNTISDLPETIGIAFSGGKDSTALLTVFSRIKADIPCRFIALTVDEGIEGYRQDTIRAAEDTCSKLGVKHHIISFSDIFGSSLDTLVSESDRNACTICGILRRRALEILAREQGIRVIATGHNQDDHAQTALMNAITGDVKKVFAGYGPSTWYARRIKPFARVSEREVTLYAMLTGFFRDLPECPYAITSLRGEVRTLLYRYEREHPGAMRNAALCEEELREKLGGTFRREPYQTCTGCGWPGSGKICQVCMVLRRPSLDNDPHQVREQTR
ncbi:TIGR00269 family protein [Methanospirillum stamsii]|uniref:TIGR00269 family protein n=1 Tax=Methanospirillum stamsii TaxID=1277351 RepID=A0A2V2N7B6_9EURY|nr:TIGR00269 family protein [Methanospirillum stamsii]PWR73606.1 TIGR00269 family protein [Methanospirillum stamsii]